MVVEMGCDGVVTVDLHCGQIQGFFHECPVADLSAATEFASYAKEKRFDLSRLVVVAPDAGAVTRARRLGDRIGAGRIVTILKRRVEANRVESMQLVGEVRDCICVIVDDMIDTGGTLCKAAMVLKENGASEVHAWATHGILTDPACNSINDCDALVEVVVTDSIPQQEKQRRCSKLKVISIAGLLAEAMFRIHEEQSMEFVRVQTPLLVSNKSALTLDGNASVETAKEDFVEEEDDWRNFPK
jgi:ribose-phosphate pyrophosphokinase